MTVNQGSPAQQKAQTRGAVLLGGNARRGGPYTVRRSDTTTGWALRNPILGLGEAGWDSTLLCHKIGDGTTAWNSLAYASIPAAAPLGPDIDLPDGYVAQTNARGTRTDPVAAFSSGRVFARLVTFTRPTLITNIIMWSGTAMTAPTAQWFEMWNLARLVIAKTVDDGATAWGATSEKPLALVGGAQLFQPGRYYVGAGYVGGAAGTVQGINSAGGPHFGKAPIMAGNSADLGCTYAGSVVNTTVRGAITSNLFQPYFGFS